MRLTLSPLTSPPTGNSFAAAPEGAPADTERREADSHRKAAGARKVAAARAAGAAGRSVDVDVLPSGFSDSDSPRRSGTPLGRG